MSSAAIRGSEATLFITADGIRFVILTKDFRETPDFDLKMDDYPGQRTSKANPQFNGVGIAFSHDEDDAQALRLRQLLMDREEAGLAPPKCNVSVRYKYRKLGERPLVVLYPESTFKPGERGYQGRKDNVSGSFEGFCETSPKILTQ